ncbi:hypothetical protein [Streptomyces albiflavescens]|uniref:hypothetical protein n=1 Tax=Streptomyces albiflavescens TaxID=1623582 RepID=UPI00166C9B3D|nr:hypothetical protein [Streptomyces albiflavescens]
MSDKVARHFGGTLSFRALVPAPGARTDWRLPDNSRSFARVAATVLAGVGGQYKAVAKTLETALETSEARQKIAPPKNPLSASRGDSVSGGAAVRRSAPASTWIQRRPGSALNPPRAWARREVNFLRQP